MFRRIRSLPIAGFITNCGNNGYGFVKESSGHSDKRKDERGYKFYQNGAHFDCSRGLVNSEVTFEIIATNVRLVNRPRRVRSPSMADDARSYDNDQPAAHTSGRQHTFPPPSTAALTKPGRVYVYGKCFIVYSLIPHKPLEPIGGNWYFVPQQPEKSPLPEKAIHKGMYLTVCMLDPLVRNPSELYWIEESAWLKRLKVLVRHVVEAVGPEHSYIACGDVVRAAPETEPYIYRVLWDVLNEQQTFLQRLREGPSSLMPLTTLLRKKFASNHRRIHDFLLVREDSAFVPPVVDFILDEIQYRKANASTTPVRTPRAPSADSRVVQLREYIERLLGKPEERKRCAAIVDSIVDDIVSLPEELQPRGHVLFPSTLGDLLENCARVVFPNDDNARHLQVEAIKKDIHEETVRASDYVIPHNNVNCYDYDYNYYNGNDDDDNADAPEVTHSSGGSSGSSSNTEGTNSSKNHNKTPVDSNSGNGDGSDDKSFRVTFKSCDESMKWPPGVKKISSIPLPNGGGIIDLSKNVSEDAKNDAPQEVTLYFKGECVLEIFSEGMKTLRKNLKELTMSDLRCAIVAPSPPKFGPNQFLNLFEPIRFDPLAVLTKGSPAPYNMPIAKKSVTIVSGASGTGKSTYAAFTIPRYVWRLSSREHVLLHITVSGNLEDDKKLIEEIKRADDVYRETVPENKNDWKLRRMFALAALRRRVDSFPDETDYVAWREYCRSKLGDKERDIAACQYVIQRLKNTIRDHSPSVEWVERDDVDKIQEPVVLVIDEIGKSLTLARAIVAAQESIYNHPWVQSHLKSLSLILCGTGAEMTQTSMDPLTVATDPSAFYHVEVCAPTQLFASKALATAVQRSPDTFKTTMPHLYAQEQRMPLYTAAKTNIRLLLLVCKLVGTMWSALFQNDTNDMSQKLSPFRISHADVVLAESIGLDGFTGAALFAYLGYNGLQQVGPEVQKVVDATLVEALRDVPSSGALCTLLPVAAVQDQEDLLDRASKLGLVVRGSGELPSPAMTAVATFAFSKPGEELDGYALEIFTARWASRLVQAQCGYTSGVEPLRFQVPWKEVPPSHDEIAELIKALHHRKVLVLLNGARAPGADVVVLQLRPEHKDVIEHMPEGTYKALWPDGIVASMTLVSDKRRGAGCDERRGAGFKDQLCKMGVLRGERPDAMRELGPLFLAWLCAEAYVGTKQTYCLETSKTPDDLTEHYSERVRSLLGDGKIIVRPRLVYGGEWFEDDSTWKNDVLKCHSEWAESEKERCYGLCPPSTFGPLSNMVWAKDHHNWNPASVTDVAPRYCYTSPQ